MPEPRAALQGTAYYRKLLRQQWRTEHVACGSPTASIKRKPATPMAAGDPAATVPPTNTPIATLLDNLNVAVEARSVYSGEPRNPDFVNLREDERIFHFLDIPAAGGAAAGTLLMTDSILFEGRRWRITRCENDSVTGISSARAELWTR